MYPHIRKNTREDPSPITDHGYERFLRGDAEYLDDRQYDDLVHLAISRSELAHARLRTVETSNAEKNASVLAAVDADDITDSDAPGYLRSDKPDSLRAPQMPILAKEKCTFQGQPVAAVVAEDRYRARDALSSIEISYDRLDSVLDPSTDAPLVHEQAPDNVAFEWTVGDKAAADRAIDRAEEQFETKIELGQVIPAPMETRGAIASYDPTAGELTVDLSSQKPHMMKSDIADTLGLEEDRVRVRAPDIGGGFGAKLHQYPGPVLAAWCTLELERPVKWISPRSKDMLSSTHARRQRIQAEIGLSCDGTFEGITLESHAPVGGYLIPGGSGVPCNVGRMLQGQYVVPEAHVQVVGRYTNTTPLAAYRGAGHPEATFVIERIVKESARHLDMDPLTIRRRNFISPDMFPYETGHGHTYDSGDYAKTLDRALAHIDYEEFRERQRRLHRDDRYVGIGFSCYTMPCGNGPSMVETGNVELELDGSIIVRTGTAEIGTGHRTSYARLVANTFDIATDRVSVVEGDTAAVVEGNGTGGSRALAVAGSAILNSARELLEEIRRVAAHLLDAQVDDVVYDRSEFSLRSAPQRRVTLTDVAEYVTDPASEFERSDLETTVVYRPPNFTYPFGTHVAIVDIDPRTGEIHIDRYIAVDDVGPRLNPELVEGQVIGGIVQGLGQALAEEAIYDDTGNLVTTTFNEYAMPTATQVPNIETDFTETPSPHTPHGVKGAGEVGAVAAPAAVANAVVDALDPFDVGELELPIRPEDIWRVIHDDLS